MAVTTPDVVDDGTSAPVAEETVDCAIATFMKALASVIKVARLAVEGMLQKRIFCEGMPKKGGNGRAVLCCVEGNSRAGKKREKKLTARGKENKGNTIKN